MSDIPMHTRITGVKSILQNAVFLVGGRWLNMLARFGYVLVLTRYLTPERYGLLNYGMAWYLAFIALTDFGLDVILSRGIGKDKACGKKIVSQTFVIRISACAIAAILCGVSGWVVESQPEVRQLLFIFSIALIGRSVAIWADAVFIAYEKTIYAMKLSAWFRPLEVVTGIFAMLCGGDILTLALVQSVSWWLQALCGIFLFRRLHIRIYFAPSLKALKTILRQGIPIMIGSIIVTWLLQGPLVMFRHLSADKDSLGQLALSIQMFFVISNIPVAINLAALPVLSRAILRQDGKDLFFVSAMLRLAIVFGTFVAIGAFGLGPWLIETVFGRQYQPTGQLMGPVSLLLVPWTIGGSIARAYYAKGRYLSPMICAGLGAVTMITGMPALISAMGALGAVVAAGAGMSIWAISILVLFTRSNGLDVMQAIVKPASIGLLVGLVFQQLMQHAGWVALPVSWMVLIAGTLILGVISKAERLEIRAILGFTKRENQ